MRIFNVTILVLSLVGTPALVWGMESGPVEQGETQHCALEGGRLSLSSHQFTDEGRAWDAYGLRYRQADQVKTTGLYLLRSSQEYRSARTVLYNKQFDVAPMALAADEARETFIRLKRVHDTGPVTPRTARSLRALLFPEQDSD